MKQKITDITKQVFDSILKVSAGTSGKFKLIVMAKFEDEVKPILIIGNAHSDIEDGHSITIVNPEQSLTSELIPGCSYPKDLLKKIVQGRCDAMVELFTETYKTEPPTELSSYFAKNPQPARFTV